MREGGSPNCRESSSSFIKVVCHRNQAIKGRRGGEEVVSILCRESLLDSRREREGNARTGFVHSHVEFPICWGNREGTLLSYLISLLPLLRPPLASPSALMCRSGRRPRLRSNQGVAHSFSPHPDVDKYGGQKTRWGPMRSTEGLGRIRNHINMIKKREGPRFLIPYSLNVTDSFRITTDSLRTTGY